jgi:hypothetical protein
MSQYRSEPVPTADTEQEWRALLDSDDPRVIRNREAWDRAISDESRRSAILPGCDNETVQTFSDGLVFSDGGLASADSSMLEGRLIYRDFMAVWNNFGIGSRLMTDYLNKACNGKHTCEPSTPGDVCTSLC